MALSSSLAGLKVLVTRPAGQANALCESLIQAGAYPITFPTIEIVPIAKQNWLKRNLADYDVIIFISRNAVAHFVAGLTESLPEHVLLASVGDGSAESMRVHGLRVDIQPEQSIGSEGLLAMPELDDISGKKIVIVRGNGGRELLAETLVQRGANVHYLEVYERVLPSPSVAQCEQALTADCIVCTSVASVKNLSFLLQKSLKILFNKPMLVISERIKETAESLGFQAIFETKDASDNAVIEQLTKMELE